MNTNRNIDHGRAFDWGRASADYAKYRDIYPPEFYRRLLDMGLCTKGQAVLDLGTGTGVLPRNLCRYGASFVGTDISEEQIAQARRLAEEAGLEIAFRCLPAEETDFPDGSFDVVTACQCFFYFDHALLAPRLSRILKRPGRLAGALYGVAARRGPDRREERGARAKVQPRLDRRRRDPASDRRADAYEAGFEIERQEVFDLRVPFTRRGGTDG